MIIPCSLVPKKDAGIRVQQRRNQIDTGRVYYISESYIIVGCIVMEFLGNKGIWGRRDYRVVLFHLTTNAMCSEGVYSRKWRFAP